ncbi:MAG: DUF1517 domain-containing protein [Leptolyngbyaceae bacterium]|nr:DUF1517 domain-containing protein [Leptolyngbyaceae bacterium]
MGKSKFKLFCATVTSLILINTIDLPSPINPDLTWLHSSQEAYARSSGGRSRGGSFKRSTTTKPSTPRKTTTTTTTTPNRPSTYTQPRNNTVVVPVPVAPYSNNYNRSTTSSADSGSGFAALVFLLIVLAILGFGAWGIYALIKKAMGGGQPSAADELDNNIVTVSKLQVALLAEAREIQAQLSELIENTDPDEPEGLRQQLQESTLALLRSPENWTHVAASSQTVKTPEEAEALFEKLSLEERSKLSAETLTKVGGKTRRRKPVQPDADEDPAAYIVVTLIVGTANDKPLFTEVRSTAALQAALEAIAAVPPEYLMVFELIWSPQDETDSLTYEELLTEYSNMLQLV